MNEASEVLSRYIAKNNEPVASARISPEVKEPMAQLNDLEALERRRLFLSLLLLEGKMLLLEAKILLPIVALQQRASLEQPKKRIESAIADFEAAFLGKPH